MWHVVCGSGNTLDAKKRSKNQGGEGERGEGRARVGKGRAEGQAGQGGTGEDKGGRQLKGGSKSGKQIETSLAWHWLNWLLG